MSSHGRRTVSRLPSPARVGRRCISSTIERAVYSPRTSLQRRSMMCRGTPRASSLLPPQRAALSTSTFTPPCRSSSGSLATPHPSTHLTCQTPSFSSRAALTQPCACGLWRTSRACARSPTWRRLCATWRSRQAQSISPLPQKTRQACTALRVANLSEACGAQARRTRLRGTRRDLLLPLAPRTRAAETRAPCMSPRARVDVTRDGVRKRDGSPALWAPLQAQSAPQRRSKR
eukprot:Amastigsp_a341765_13.p1 type:complete len:232 gc:universal Amastigsp_a341765_13:1167-472(-)